MERVAGVSVTPHYCRIEEKPADWYREFHVIALGLDSLEVRRRVSTSRLRAMSDLLELQARSYINAVVCGFLGACVPCLAQFPPSLTREPSAFQNSRKTVALI